MRIDEIIEKLSRLTATELAQVEAKLRELIEPGHKAVISDALVPRIYTPRFAEFSQSKDFTKQVLELDPDAAPWCA